MGKDCFYFSHDTNARNDDKILQLRAELGWEGYGLYWAIIECLREATDYKYNLKRLNGLALQLNTTVLQIENIVSNFDLFESDAEYFWSSSLLKRMKQREELSEKNKANVQKRWENIKTQAEKPTAKPIEKTEVNTDVIPNEYQNDTTVIQIDTIKGKERKEKERKEKERKEKENNTLFVAKQEFESARKLFPGTKKGFEIEFSNFQKHKDWQIAVFNLKSAIEKEKLHKERQARNSGWAPQWKNFQTWINQRCWEDELCTVTEFNQLQTERVQSCFATG